ncbi:alpha/beta hydrolase fold protein [Natrialba magadii ATCC 43099]|uniref:Alpha/beta hydrolase fold protein n=1 Tax=Natrialba magadii (strain ATCC 43099 / DSM 3394 / CCM 3739 / CIP 104546 / IAM 13178 / JCM 8861 / NBRC 102185 / NCIMB 2190 / MS3) TaxID=547559 RepID=D3STA5_NATMM|nr:alpha/beta fold hydrolase [Natrialba magadii]ADD06972.1 alpha/beta hydrolase fold protein [Natrialba magadii ATCC 43099]ELY28885.1 hydrolase-like protein [Natrialba magadii ATCC 43099]
MPREFTVSVTDGSSSVAELESNTKSESSAQPESVAAVHHEAPSDDWLVFCHGLRSDKSGSYKRRCQRAVDEGYNAVRFDCRGCGASDRDFVDHSLSTRLADLQAVLDSVLQDDHSNCSSLTLFGSSFGGAVALHTAATDDRIDAVATRAPVTDISAFDRYRTQVEREGVLEFDTGERLDERFFDDLDCYRYPFADVAATLDVPVAIFHGAADDSVPVSDSLDAAGVLETDVFVQVFEGEGHIFSREAEARLRRLLFAWLAETEL